LKQPAKGSQSADARIRASTAQGRYADAAPLHKRSLAINEKTLGPDHPNVALSLHNLAAFYVNQGRYADGEPLYLRSLAIKEKALGPDPPDVGACGRISFLLYRLQDSADRDLRCCRIGACFGSDRIDEALNRSSELLALPPLELLAYRV
jgi:tetratricopeptide (TPR) repeat protein